MTSAASRDFARKIKKHGRISYRWNKLLLKIASRFLTLFCSIQPLVLSLFCNCVSENSYFPPLSFHDFFLLSSFPKLRTNSCASEIVCFLIRKFSFWNFARKLQDAEEQNQEVELSKAKRCKIVRRAEPVVHSKSTVHINCSHWKLLNWRSHYLALASVRMKKLSKYFTPNVSFSRQTIR